MITLRSSDDTYQISELIASSASIYQAINGDYECEVRVPAAMTDGIEPGMILAVPDANGTVQKFRILKPIESLDEWLLQGRHITDDLKEEMILDRGWIDSTGQRVWPELLKAGISDRRFGGTSQIQSINSVKIVRKSVWDAMTGGAENTFMSRWGGELERNNYMINNVMRLGTDDKYTIEYKVNLTGITITEDESQIANRIIPTALVGESGVLSLPESYIDAANIGETAVPHVRHIHYGDIRVGVEEDGVILYPTVESAYAEMRTRVADLYQSGASRPVLSVDISFVDLAKTEEYKAYAPMLQLYLGDGVVAHYKGRTIRQRIVAYKWDALRGEYESLTLGAVRPSVGARLAQINAELLNEAETRSYSNVYAPLVDRIRTLNESAARAVGMYSTERRLATGGRVVYYHDKPTLEQSMLIEYYPEPGSRYWTQSGWNNGSPVWMYGNDSSGMLVMRLLAVEGIDGKWIRTGTLDANRITVTSGQTLDSKLSTVDGLQEELTESLRVGGRNLVLNSDKVRTGSGYLLTTIELSERLDPDQTYTISLKGTKDDRVDFRIWFNGPTDAGPTLADSGDGIWSATFKPRPPRPDRPEIEQYRLQLYNAPSTPGIDLSIVEWIKVERGKLATAYTRSPEDVERDIESVRLESANALDSFAQAVATDIEDLQGQVDGAITTWFYPVPPQNDTLPSSSWTDAETRNRHLGDLYYDTETGYVYRWQIKSGQYSWQRITDTDVTKALEEASKAQDTADNKRRVFVVTPQPPYDVGDMWTQGPSGELMVAQTGRKTGVHQPSDWVKAAKYTDDSRAVAAENAAKAYAEAQVALEKARADAYADGVVSAEEQARIDQAEKNLKEAKEHADELNAAIALRADRLETLQSELTAAVQGGGRNLWRNSDFAEAGQLNGWRNIYGTATWEGGRVVYTQTNITNPGAVRLEKSYYDEITGDVTISIRAKFPETMDNLVRWAAPIGMVFRYPESVVKRNIPRVEGWHTYSMAFTVISDPGSQKVVRLYYASDTMGSIAEIDWEKLEHGTLPTAHTRAPEDIEKDIAAARQAALDAMAHSVVNRTTITDHGVTIEQHTTAIGAQAGQIEGLHTTTGVLESVTQTLTNTQTAHGNTLESHTTTISRHAEDITGLTAKTDTHDTEIGNLKTTTTTLTNTQTAQGNQISAISTDLSTITRQHHGLPPPTNYKTGDRWALPGYTNTELAGYTNGQLQTWGVTNSMLSGGELLAKQGRTNAYSPADWTWIATGGSDLERLERMLTDISAGRIMLSGQTRLQDGGWQVGNFAIHTIDYSRWQHADGSYTQIGSAPGLEQYIASRGYRYHNLMHVTTISGSDTLTKWAQLPDEFKGKPFRVYMAVSDSAQHVEAGGDPVLDNRSAIRRLVATVSPDAEIDYVEARVPYMCYKLTVDIHKVINDPLNSPWRVTRAIGIMIAIA